MKVKNFTYLWCYFVLSCMFVIPHMSYSQGNTLACNDNVQISLDATCGGVTLDMLLEGAVPAFSVPTSGPNTGFGYGIEVGGIQGRTVSTAECSLFGVDSGDSGSALTPADFGEMTTMCGEANPLRPKAEFPWGNFVNQTVTYKLTELSGGNSCWGTVTIELNAKPVINTPACVAMDVDTETDSEIELVGSISDDSDDDILLDAEWHKNAGTGVGLNTAPNGVENGEWYADLFEVDPPCDHVLSWTSSLKYPVFKAKGEIDWILADLEVYSYTVSGGVFQATLLLQGAVISSETKLLVKASAANAVGSYEIVLNGMCPGTDKQFPQVWCEGAPACFVSFDDFSDLVDNGCYDIELLPPVVEETGDICEKVVINTKYFGKVSSHGTQSTVLLLDQTYEILKLTPYNGGDEFDDDDDDDDPTPIDPATGSGTGTAIYFPKSFAPINCGIVSMDDVSPATIAKAASKTGSGTFAYPYFLDMHDSIPKSQKFCQIVHTAVPVDTVNQMTLVDPDNIADSGDEIWVLLPVVKKEILETEKCVFYQVNADGEPVVDANGDNVCDATVYIYVDSDGDAQAKPSTSKHSRFGDPIALGVSDCTVDKVPEVELLVPEKFCNLVVGFDDTKINACGGGFKIIRNWTVIDWCDSRNIISGVQFIEVRDTEAPTFEKKFEDDVVSIDPWICSAKYKIGDASVWDNCVDVDDIEISVANNEGIYDPKSGYITSLWLTGEPIEIIILAADKCGNVGRDTFELLVVDEVKPVAICQDQVNVTLTGNPNELDGGVAKVFAASLDAGSHDAGCGDVTTCVLRKVDFDSPILDIRGDQLTDGKGNLLYNAENGCYKDGTLEVEVAVDKNTTDKVKFDFVICHDYTKFCCDDVSSLEYVLVATDKAGNSNICWGIANIEDKSAASLACRDVEISCLDDITDPSIVPPAAPIAAACASAVADYIETPLQDGCGGGRVIREYFIDGNGDGEPSVGEAYCKQTITITNAGAEFNPRSIKWPKHYTGEVFEGVNLECGKEKEVDIKDGKGNVIDTRIVVEVEETDDYDVEMGAVSNCSAMDTDEVPVWCTPGCGLVGYSVEVDTVIASDACLKLIKRWTVIDWCTWESNGKGSDDDNDTGGDDFEAVEDWAQGVCDGCPENVLADPIYFRYGKDVEVDGYYTFDQVIKVVDDSAPEINGPAEFTVSTSGGATSKDDDTECTGSETLTASASDLCDGEMVSADLISWIVRRFEDGELDTTISATGATVDMGSGEGSPGDEHLIKWTATDGCGNSTTAETVVTFGDDKAPTPLCISGVTTAFMTSGTVDIWASDFNIGSFDNCTDVTFSMVPSGDSPIHPDSTDHDTQTNYTFNCADLANFADFDVYVWDANGNGDFCTVGVLVGGSCNGEAEPGAGAMIAGSVATAFGDMVENTTVNANSAAGQEYPKTRQTDNSGEYSFASNPLTFDYNLSAEKDDEYLNGVSTFDIVLIQKHILNTAVFENAYQYLAADINNSGSISASDLVELRKLILGTYNELPANSSWRFVDASQTFADASSPWPFDEAVNVNNLSTDMMSEDFVAVKIGDVNGNAQANGLMRASTRSNGTLELTAENQTLSAGETVRVAVRANNFNKVAGYQFTLNHTGLTLEGVEAGAINATEANVGINKGQMTMSWSEAIAVSSDEVLFTLVFKSNVATQLSSSLELNSGITVAEAYVGENLDRMDVSLAIGDDSGVAAFDLYQNNPNPFEAETSIGFTLPEAGEATLTIFDVAGKMVTKIDGDYAKGYNEIVVTRNQVNVAGVLYYELQSGDFTATKKMIVIE